MPPAIEARALSKRFLLRHNRAQSLKVRFLGLLHPSQREVVEEFWALRDVSVTIGRGESVALVGRNGSGKSTLLKLIAGIHRPTSGHLLLERDARIGTMIELGIGFHPDLNGTENVFLNAAIHGLSRTAIEAIYPGIVEYAGLGPFMDVPLKNYSSGMHMRLGFAIAASMQPDIVLLDEIFAVGDEDFQRKCMKTMEQFTEEGRTIVFVSHAPSAVRAICRRVCVLEQGRLLFDGDVDAGLAEYQRMLAATARRSSNPARQAADHQSAEATPPDARVALSAWELDFLRREGLRPDHRVLHICCDELQDNEALARYVGCAHYQRWNISVPLDGPLLTWDVAIASPLLSRVSVNAAARCFALAIRVMRSNGRLYATWLEDDDPVSVPDLPPFHYPYAMLAGLAAAVGGDISRVAAPSHPTGESALVIFRP
jgi:ABC-type polysaccharide/polyol phosphate transport system ATPase subunit